MTDQTPAQLAEPYILDGIRSYLDGPPVVADHRHHRDVDRMAWLLAGVDRLRARNAELSRRLGDARTEIDRLRAHRDQLHTETLRLGISLAEAIHERHQLRTDLAGAERYRTAALAVVADLTDDLTEARAAAFDDAVVILERLAEKLRRLNKPIRAMGVDAAARVLRGRAELDRARAHEPATAPGTPDPDPSEGTAPTARPRPAQEAHEGPPCIPVTVHTYGLTDTARHGLIDRVAAAAHVLDEDVSCTVTGTCPQCDPAAHRTVLIGDTDAE